MKLTVVIPVYNGQNYIVNCLESLRKQTFKDFTVLLFNDGSNDHSARVICEYTEKHPNISLTLINQENSGVASTRNKAIECCETPYIAFVDQDDELSPDYLETYLKKIEETNANIICGGYQRVHPETGKVLRVVRLSEDSWSKFIVVSPWAHLYRTAFLKENPIRFLDTTIGEDIYFSLMAYAYSDKVVTIDDIGYKWIDNPESHSNRNQRKAQKNIDPLILLNALKKDLPKTSKIPDDYLEYYFYRYIVWYLLFTVRRTSKVKINEQYQKLIDWLSEQYPRFSYNRFISLFRPAGELVSIRLAVWGFNLLYRLKLVPAFLSVLAERDSKKESR